MIKPWKILLPALLMLSLISVNLVHVNAQAQVYDQISYDIHPTQGGANTTIYLSFTSQSTSVQNVTSANILWDDVVVQPLNQNGTLSNGAYYYSLTVPTEPPFSTNTTHTIQVDSNIAPYGPVSFNFTFTITEFIPSPEYLALNDTYNTLLTNYTTIDTNYTQLLDNFNTLSANYNNLTDEHTNDTQWIDTLTSQINVLNSNYNSLAANYNLLATLPANFTILLANFQALNTSYLTLMQDYNLLNTSYTGLLTNYNSLIGQLNFSRNLSYALIIITITLAIITIYFVFIKPKNKQKTR